MLDPFGGQSFETFDPYADEAAATESALYAPDCWAAENP
jgi:hypothetical protein